MNIKQLINSIKLSHWENYLEFVKGCDAEKMLKEEPLIIKDRALGNSELTETDFEKILGHTEMHNRLAKKYSLKRIAAGETDFERAVNVMNWLTENTFYSGAQFAKLPDDSLKILKYSFGKPFNRAICCRLKAIVFADCLTAVGMKAYPVCMISSEFKSGCHFIAHVYISELDKWCAFDPSFGCWFTDKNGNLINAFEMRDIFLSCGEPVVKNYCFNGTTECFDIYKNCFLKLCLSNLSTWNDNSMERRTGKKWKGKKKFQSKIPM